MSKIIDCFNEISEIAIYFLMAYGTVFLVLFLIIDHNPDAMAHSLGAYLISLLYLYLDSSE